jgi:hypothetical protein
MITNTKYNVQNLYKNYLGKENLLGLCGQGTSFPLLPLNEKK